MSRSGEVILAFAGEDRTFRLAIGEWRKVQEKCDAGPGEIQARLAPAFAAGQHGLTFDDVVKHGMLGRWKVDDVREPIFQGLLGGGMTAPAAMALIKDWVDERPLFENVALAYQIVTASIIGAADEAAVGEPQAVAEDSPTSPAASSGSGKAASTRKAAPSDGPPGKSMN